MKRSSLIKAPLISLLLLNKVARRHRRRRRRLRPELERVNVYSFVPRFRARIIAEKWLLNTKQVREESNNRLYFTIYRERERERFLFKE